MKKRGKQHMTYQDKCQKVLSVLNWDVKRRVAVGYGNGKEYRMSEIAKLAGFARSSKFMAHLYSMCDSGALRLVTVNRDVNGSGVTDINVYFMLPEPFDEMLAERNRNLARFAF